MHKTKADGHLVQKGVEEDHSLRIDLSVQTDFHRDTIRAGKRVQGGLKFVIYYLRRMSNTSVNSSTDPDSDCHMHQRQMLRGMLSALYLANQRTSLA